MANGVSGVLGLLVPKLAVVERQQERECAITLLLLMVELTVLVTQNKLKIVIPELVQQVIQYNTKVRLNI